LIDSTSNLLLRERVIKRAQVWVLKNKLVPVKISCASWASSHSQFGASRGQISNILKTKPHAKFQHGMVNLFLWRSVPLLSSRFLHLNLYTT
jgi:hypothetical protein